MAASNLLAMIDDIATVLDDVAVMSKIAAKKTAGVLGDDLALNAQQVAGVNADREIPVVWAVAKGSLVNKAILVPLALLISALAPWAVLPLLMVGGLYLCFEGFEKVFHHVMHGKEDDIHHAELTKAIADPKVDLVAFEKDKIKGAVRTDFILSAEIIAITLDTVTGKPLLSQITVLTGIAFTMTVGVYGIVAGIVKIDDLGFYFNRQAAQSWWGGVQRWLGQGLLKMAPVLMKTLSVVGTIAMFLVGGGILTHGIPAAHHAVDALVRSAQLSGWGALQSLVPTLMDALVGIIAGGCVLAVVALIQRFKPK